VRIFGVTITEASSESNGGGISIGTFPKSYGSLVLVDSVVTGNTAAFDGGGIYIEVGSALGLINSRVVDNTACDGGGCFHHNGKVAMNVPNDIAGW
jgi:hypothetical protein